MESGKLKKKLWWNFSACITAIISSIVLFHASGVYFFSKSNACASRNIENYGQEQSKTCNTTCSFVFCHSLFYNEQNRVGIQWTFEWSLFGLRAICNALRQVPNKLSCFPIMISKWKDPVYLMWDMYFSGFCASENFENFRFESMNGDKFQANQIFKKLPSS